jgi:hypothetical protein
MNYAEHVESCEPTIHFTLETTHPKAAAYYYGSQEEKMPTAGSLGTS